MEQSSDTRYQDLVDQLTDFFTKLHKFKGRLSALEGHIYSHSALANECELKQKIEEMEQFLETLKKRHKELVELVEQKSELVRSLEHEPLAAGGYLRQLKDKSLLEEVEKRLTQLVSHK